MPWILLAVLVVLMLIWGLASISQSYAAAQQAQAAIEASRATQIASVGNLLVIVVLVLLVIVLLVCLYYVLKNKPKNNADPLPALLTMLVYQMLQEKRPEPLPTIEADIPNEVLRDLWMN